MTDHNRERTHLVLIGFYNHWQVAESAPFNCYWNSQVSNDSYRCLYLLCPVIKIHMGNDVLWGMVIWIEFIFHILDLEDRWYSLLTEGNHISSAATIV
jgi:hypothetical protein